MGCFLQCGSYVPIVIHCSLITFLICRYIKYQFSTYWLDSTICTKARPTGPHQISDSPLNFSKGFLKQKHTLLHLLWSFQTHVFKLKYLQHEGKLLPVKIPKLPSTQSTLYYSTSEVNMCVCVKCYQVKDRKVKVQPTTYHEGTEAEWRHRSTLSLISAPDGGGWSTPRP